MIHQATWYTEELVLDQWSPVLYHGEKPNPERVGAPNKVWRADPVRVLHAHARKPLAELRMRYSPGRPIFRSRRKRAIA